MDVLLDTHAWVWSFMDDGRLSAEARAALEKADAVRVSAISFFEIGQKVRIGKWPEMELGVDELGDLLTQQGGLPATLTPEIALLAAKLDWSHRDPFDRIIAATAMLGDHVLLSADAAFDTLEDARLRRIW